jgi:hypothetical protein
MIKLMARYNVDQLYDFLLSIDVRPVVELSFMPQALVRAFNPPRLVSSIQNLTLWLGSAGWLLAEPPRQQILEYDPVCLWPGAPILLFKAALLSCAASWV